MTLDLLLTPAPHYTLDGREVQNGDPIEVFDPNAGRWTCGRFSWYGPLSVRPWLLTTGFECAIGEHDQVRWAQNVTD